MAPTNAVIVLQSAEDIVGTPVSNPTTPNTGNSPTEDVVASERPGTAGPEIDAQSTAPQDAEAEEPMESTDSAQTEQVEAAVEATAEAASQEQVPAAAPVVVVVDGATQDAPATVTEEPNDDPIPELEETGPTENAEGEANPEAEPPVEDWDAPVDGFPFFEDDIDYGSQQTRERNQEPAAIRHRASEMPFFKEDPDYGEPFTGEFIVHDPFPAPALPFDELEDADLTDVIKGNFASFFQLRCGQEFYRNYVRGNTIRRLRTAPDAIKVKGAVLNGIFQLPVEVLYDVLELTHPLDLLHLSRSTKALRATILSKKSEHVWKFSYENCNGEVPLPPKEISHPKWTAMVYDDAYCDFCGRPGALLDFALNEHYCEDCQRKYLVEQNDMVRVTDNYPRLLPLLYQVLVPTYRQSGGKYQTYYESFNNARYRRKEVEDMIETLQGWYMTIDEGLLPEAGEKFEQWSSALISKSNTISEYSQNFNNWATSFYYTLCSELSTRQREMADKCMKKFSKLGYDQRDTEAASSDVYYYFRGAEVWRLSPREFEKHKAEMIQKIEAQKRERLKRERKEYFEKFYKEYKATLKPEVWEHLPPSDITQYEETFYAFINQDGETVEDLKADIATKRLPAYISDWQFDREKELYHLLPGVTYVEEESYTVPEGETLTPEEVETRSREFRETKRAEMKATMDERMNRATAIFSCISCKNGRHSGLAVVGWRDACTHMCGSYSHYFHSNWEFCSVGYAAAASLVRQLGMDSDAATVEEMDKRDARFFCGNCPVKTRNKVQGRKAYTWRECVTHAVEKEEDHTHAIPAWLLLSEPATAFTKAHEIHHPSPRKSNWSCNHCAEHIEGGVLLKAAKTHVKEKHAIENPVLGVDVIWLRGRFERNRNSKRRPIFHYGIEPTCNLICKVCREGKVKRMWTIQALVPHLFHMHGISMPQSARDYSKIEVLAT